MTVESYIYEKKEYRKTGRVAKKEDRRIGGREPKIKELVELRPVNMPEDNNDYNVWVSVDDLFEVE